VTGFSATAGSRLAPPGAGRQPLADRRSPVRPIAVGPHVPLEGAIEEADRDVIDGRIEGYCVVRGTSPTDTLVEYRSKAVGDFLLISRMEETLRVIISEMRATDRWEAIEELIDHLVETGKARLVYHNYPFIDGEGASNGGESDQSANASMCANEQGKFWEMKAVLYANWNGENQGNLSNRRLVAMAEAINLDMDAFNACFNDNKYKDDIQASFDYGQELGVSGTPSAFVNGVKVGQPGKIPTFQEIAVAVDAIVGTGE